MVLQNKSSVCGAFEMCGWFYFPLNFCMLAVFTFYAQMVFFNVLV